MNVIVLQVFVSLMLVAAGVVLFVFSVSSRTLEHQDRLSLAPLDDDQPVSPSVAGVASNTVGPVGSVTRVKHLKDGER